MDYGKNLFGNASSVPHVSMIQLQNQEEFALPRWSFYSASLACLTTWLEMMCMVGKIPKFGKYVHMFRLIKIMCLW